MRFKFAPKIITSLVFVIIFFSPFSNKAYAVSGNLLTGVGDMFRLIGGTMNIFLPELIMDCHSGDIRPGFYWEVPFQGTIGDRIILFDPTVSYYSSDKVKGFSYTQYIEPFSLGVKNFHHFIGCGFNNDTYGAGPKFDYRINIGDSKSWGSVNYIFNISYIPKINKEFHRCLISTGLKMYF